MDGIPSPNEYAYSPESSSNLSTLENETDEFGRLLLRHRRDQRAKMAAATASTQQQPFRKARPRLSQRLARGDDAVNDWHEQGRDHDLAYLDHGGLNHNTHETDTSADLPREWGRRAKKQTDWMSKIQEPSDDGDTRHQAHPHLDEGAILPRRTAFTGDVGYFHANPELPLLSIENTPPRSRIAIRHHSSPSSMRHMNTTLKLDDGSENQDFSTISLLASTPAQAEHLGKRKIDELTMREIEAIEKQGVATKTLDQISDRPMNSALRRQRSSQIRQVKSGFETSEPRPLTARSGSIRSRIPRRQSLIGNKENVSPVAGDSSTTFKSTETVAVTNNAAAGAVNIDSLSRPSHKRNESMNLLKRLARVSSMSPSPQAQRQILAMESHASGGVDVFQQRDQSRPTEQNTENGVFEATCKLKPSKRHVRRASSADDRYPELGKTETGSNTRAQDRNTGDFQNKGEAAISLRDALTTDDWIEKKAAVSKARSQDGKFEQTQGEATHQPKGLFPFQPMTGGPLEASQTRRNSCPSKRKSVLTDLLQDDNDPINSQYGESTLASLENIINPDMNFTDSNLPAKLEKLEAQIADGDDKQDASTQAEKDRRQESLAMEQMNKHLRAARTSVQDANEKLRRVENHMEDPDAIVAHAQPIERTVKRRYGKTTCPDCGHIGYVNVWRALWSELLENFYVSDPLSDLPAPLKIRLTWLGLFSLLLFSWYASEMALCTFFCHPLASSSMVGYGVDPDAPKFPFVIPTLVFRPFRFIWRPICDASIAAATIVWQEMFGENAASAASVGGRSHARMRADTADGFWEGITRSDWIGETTASMAAGTTRVVQSVVDAIDDAGSIWDDQVFA